MHFLLAQHIVLYHQGTNPQQILSSRGEIEEASTGAVSRTLVNAEGRLSICFLQVGVGTSSNIASQPITNFISGAGG